MQNNETSPNSMTPEAIRKEELIAAEEELKLITRVQEGDKDALSQLLNARRSFVIGMVKQYEGKGLSFDDLIIAGNRGLELACMKFKPSRGFKFICYAVWWVRQSIIVALNQRK